MASKIINACVALHNICVDNNIPLEDVEDYPEFEYGIFENEPINYVNEVNNPQLVAGRRVRQNIVNNHFTAVN